MITKLGARLKKEVRLKDHQKRVVKRLEKTPGLLLYHGLGSGKTLSAIASTLNDPTDFVVPASLRENAKKELKKFTRGNKAEVTSYNMFLKADKLKSALILDEAHRVGTAGTKITQDVIRKAPEYKKRILLTGTPIRNSPSEIAPLLRVLNPDSRVVTSPSEFNKKFVEKTPVDPGVLLRLLGAPAGHTKSMRNRQEFKNIVDGLIDYHAPSNKDYPTVSSKTYITPMNKKQLKLYSKAEGTVPWSVRLKIKHGIPLAPKEKVHFNFFANSTRQLSNTTSNFGGDEVTPKFQLMSKHIDKIVKNKGKVLAYSNYLGSGIKEYSNLLTKKKIPHRMFDGSLNDKDRKQVVQDYNAGKVKALLISGAGSEGLDLKGTSDVQILEPHWNEARTDQVIGRAARYKSHSHLPSNKQRVKVRRYLSELPDGKLHKYLGIGSRAKSADQYLSEMGKTKTKLNKEFLDVLKEVGSKKKP